MHILGIALKEQTADQAGAQLAKDSAAPKSGLARPAQQATAATCTTPTGSRRRTTSEPELPRRPLTPADDHAAHARQASGPCCGTS
jgi:hypothetical protein